jgi:SPP1 gp7 family putative phage head morphogenesis protein
MTLRYQNADRLLDPSRTRRLGESYARQAIARLRRCERLVLQTLRQNAPALAIYNADSLGPRAMGVGFLRGGAREQAEQMRRYSEDLVFEVLVEGGVELDKLYYSQAVETAYRSGLAQAARHGGLTARERRILLRSPTHHTAARALARDQVTLLRGLGYNISGQIRDEIVTGINQRLTEDAIAARISAKFDLAEHRARMIARTETVKAHAEGSLNAYLAMRFEHVSALVEYTTSVHRQTIPCPLCSDLTGKIYTIESARGIIPRHPNCACAWVPVFDRPVDKAKTSLR